MRKIIAVDVDDVLLKFVDPFLEFMNPIYDTRFTQRHVKNYDLIKTFPINEEEMRKRIDEFFSNGYLHSLKPVYGAKKGMLELAKLYEVIIITSRSREVKEGTLGSLRLTFPSCFSELLFARGYVHKEGKSKAEICQERDVYFLIDDSYVFADECAKNGRRALLLNRPWNQGKTHDLVTRVQNWREIVEVLKQNSINLNQ
jgi:uncharacterized HAD superfamily protein